MKEYLREKESVSVSRDDREDLTMAMITNDWLTGFGAENSTSLITDSFF